MEKIRKEYCMSSQGLLRLQLERLITYQNKAKRCQGDLVSRSTWCRRGREGHGLVSTSRRSLFQQFPRVKNAKQINITVYAELTDI
jgi:hypothetical protein